MGLFEKSFLELVFLHQVAERAVGDSEHIGCFGLYPATLLERALQQRTFDAGHIVFHPNAVWQFEIAADLRKAARRRSSGRGTRLGPLDGQFYVEFIRGLE